MVVIRFVTLFILLLDVGCLIIVWCRAVQCGAVYMKQMLERVTVMVEIRFHTFCCWMRLASSLCSYVSMLQCICSRCLKRLRIWSTSDFIHFVAGCGLPHHCLVSCSSVRCSVDAWKGFGYACDEIRHIVQRSVSRGCCWLWMAAHDSHKNQIKPIANNEKRKNVLPVMQG